MNKKKDFNFKNLATKYDMGFEAKGSNRFYVNLIQQINLEDWYNVLDVGCGTGTVLLKLEQKCNFVGHGIDIEEEMLKQAKSKLPNMDIRKSCCSKLPYNDNSMDVVITCMAFHHFDNQTAFLKEALRVLKEDGTLYICDPRFPWIIRKGLDIYALVHTLNAKFYNNNQLINFVESNGFVICNNIKDAYVQSLSFKRRI